MERLLIALKNMMPLSDGIHFRQKCLWINLILIIAVTSTSTLLSSHPVQAQTTQQATQQKRSPLPFLDFLFGKSRKKTEPQQPVLKQKTQPENRRTKNSNPRAKSNSSAKAVKPRSTPAATVVINEVPEVSKNPDADKVLVIGDFIGSGLAEGLQQAYASNPDIHIINQTNGSSGLVRDDYYDWIAQLPKIIEQQKPAVIVMMIGTNDRQSITTAQGSYAAGSEKWTSVYQQRVDDLISLVNEKKIPLIWVGQPSYKSPALSQLVLSTNAIYRKSVEKSGGDFTDVWDGFADESGNFSQTGVDINGQTVRLRNNDGINFTSAAKRKLAFYVEKPLMQLLKPATPPIAPSSEGLPEITEPEKVNKKITRIGPINITDLDKLDDDVLLDDVTTNMRSARPPANNNNKLDEVVVPPIGRIDNFTANR